jgi:1,4-dihydroxy-6-naphthoate synthase
MADSQAIRLAYSPDSDDAFMFWAIAHGRIDTHGLSFVHTRADTEALNRGSETSAAPDVTALSIHQYAYLADRYLLLPHGGSVGAGYGPVLVAHAPRHLESLAGRKIGVPGLRTSAYLVLRLLLPDFEPVIVPVAPFRRAYDALRSGEVEAALLIHEGRLLYEREGLSRVTELGEAWHARTGLPLPLGGNAIARSLGTARIALVSQVLRESIKWALANRDEVMSSLIADEHREGVPHDRALFDRYLGMYANQDTLDYGPRGRLAIEELLRQGHAAGIIPHAPRVEFAP